MKRFPNPSRSQNPKRFIVEQRRPLKRFLYLSLYRGSWRIIRNFRVNDARSFERIPRQIYYLVGFGELRKF